MREPLRVLVVEDEAIQREALADMCRVVLGDLPADVAGAADGAQAVEKAATFVPDIVLMDIRMPNLDGLEGARRLTVARTPPPEIIFVTAYDDFAYTRQALNLGAADYLLKPVSLEELRHVMLAASDRVRATRRSAALAERTARRLRAAMPLLRLEVFRDLLDGALVCPSSSPALRERLGLAGVSGRLSVAAFFELKPAPEVATGAPSAPGPGAAETAVALQDVGVAFARRLRRELGSAWLTGPAGPGRIGLFLEPPPAQRGSLAREWGLRLAEALRTEARSHTGHPVATGVGEDHPGDAGLGESVREAWIALIHSERVGGDCLVHIWDVRDQADRGTPAAAFPAVGPLLDSIRRGQTGPAAALGSRLAKEMALGHDPRGDLAGVWIAEAVSLAGVAAIEAGTDPSLIRDAQARALRWRSGSSASSSRPALEMEQALVSFSRDLAALVQETQSDRQRGLVKRAVAHIRANFTRQLTLEDVAREVHVSHYYLSHLLRRETGKSFTDHLTQFRMAKARELMARLDLGVSEIADRCGFCDGNYFSRVFKRETGLTPSAYRKGFRPPSPGGATPSSPGARKSGGPAQGKSDAQGRPKT